MIPNYIIKNIPRAFARFLALIPLIIFKTKTNKAVNNDSINNNNRIIEYLFSGNKNKNVKGKWSFIILASVIYFIQSIFFNMTNRLSTNSWNLYILITPIFYYLIFKIKLYKHHYLSIIFILLIGGIIDLSLGYLVEDIHNNLYLLLLKYLREIMFSFHNVL